MQERCREQNQAAGTRAAATPNVTNYGNDTPFDDAPVRKPQRPAPTPEGRHTQRPSSTPQDIRDHLWVYGYRALLRMIGDGEIYEKCRAKKRPLKPTLDDRETLRLSMDDRSGLAGDTLVSAMDTLDDTWHTWEAEYGAKLETSFVGGLVLHFPAVFRK